MVMTLYVLIVFALGLIVRWEYRLKKERESSK
jgi:hypothetical protein